MAPRPDPAALAAQRADGKSVEVDPNLEARLRAEQAAPGFLEAA